MGYKSSLFLLMKTLSIDPILLGQPTLWVYPSDTAYLENTVAAAPADGDSLNVFKRYNDSAFNPTSAVSNKAIYSILAGQPHPYGYVFWNGSGTTTLGYYRVGTTSDFSFLHQLNGGATIYWINKNNTIENTANTKVLAGTTVSTGLRGVLLTIGNSSSTLRRRQVAVYNDTGGVSAFTLTESADYTRTTDYPVRLDSIRYDLSKSVGQDCAWWYINGVLDNTTTMLNAPSNTATSNTVMNVGNRNSSNLRYNGYVGDFIIFNTIHDEATHTKVCNFLKHKWGI